MIQHNSGVRSVPGENEKYNKRYILIEFVLLVWDEVS